MPEIGKRIKEKRESLGITQEELAQKLGYKNKSTIAKIEAGANDIVQSKVIEFANALETSVAYLMGWEKTESTNLLTSNVSKDSFPLAPVEKEIITKYRAADEIAKAMVRRALDIEDVEACQQEGTA